MGALIGASRVLVTFEAVALIVAALYFGRPVLMPLAIAILLTFLLRPVVVWLERRHLPRVVAVIGAVGMVLVATAVAGWIVTYQLNALASGLDDYGGHLKAKINALKGTKSEAVENIQDAVIDVTGAGEEENKPTEDSVAESDATAQSRAAGQPGESDRSAEPKAAAEEAQPVRIVDPPPTPTETLWLVWNSVAGTITEAAIVVVLVIFMLIGYEDLRNRLLRLAGEGKVTFTTKAIDDAGRRISRYLLMNAMINGGYGACVFSGLWLIGVDYAALWGFLAAALRFVPYIGPITASLLPIAMSFVQFPSWVQPSLVIGMFVVLELITNNAIEPLAYGKSAGVSTVALLVCATFWTWLWGPMGLVLSVPLTVVLAVLGKHIPQLQPLGILLGDEPALDPSVSYYQRLVAGDVDEAAEIVEERLKTQSRLEVFDTMLIPALALAERDALHGELSDVEQTFVWETSRELIEDDKTEARATAEDSKEPPLESGISKVRILGLPAKEQADELVLAMLAELLPESCELTVAVPAILASELVEMCRKSPPDVILVSALSPASVTRVRYMCKRLRQSFPRIELLVGRWGFTGGREGMAAALAGRGASQVVVTLTEALDAISRIQPRHEAPPAPSLALALPNDQSAA